MQLVIVSNRLPVSVKKENDKLSFYPSIGGLARGLGSYAKDKKNKWVGWPGIARDDLTESEQQQVADELRKHNCYPVFLSQKQLDEFYDGYSNSILWPLFHDRPISDKAYKHTGAYWQAYKRVNAKFAEAVLALSEPTNNIWVHDYQLLLLPEMLRKERPNDHIGFFSHIPFPKPELFCKLDHHQELIDGVLGADVVGFHTKSYTKNFLDAVAITGAGMAERRKVILSDRVVRVTDFPIGIDYKQYVDARQSPAVMKELTKLRLKYRNKKVILTVDRLDPAKGLVERVWAFQTLLKENPAYHNKVVMIMLVVPSRENIDEYAALKKELEKTIRDTNRQFGTVRWKPIHYRYTALSFVKVTSLYRRADIAFIVPLRDGMNLVAKEYLASKPFQRGILVLSKTAGAAEQLTEAILVDPQKPRTLVIGLQQALKMPQAEFRERTKQMQKGLAQADINTWAGSFIRSLGRSTELYPRQTKPMDRSILEDLVTTYEGASSRRLLLDYDGTLAPFADRPEKAAPTTQLYKLLDALAADTRNKVVIISGRSKHDLGAWFGHHQLSLVAEHGAFVKEPSGEWQETACSSDGSWQEQIIPVLEKYSHKTLGSFVERKEASLVWHFRQANPYHVQKSLVLLRRALRSLAQELKLELRQGNMILEIRPIGLNKGCVTNMWLEESPDFVIGIGDDYTDEDIFTSLPGTAHTVKVGRGKTAASIRVKNTDDVLELLTRFKNAP